MPPSVDSRNKRKLQFRNWPKGENNSLPPLESQTPLSTVPVLVDSVSAVQSQETVNAAAVAADLPATRSHSGFSNSYSSGRSAETDDTHHAVVYRGDIPLDVVFPGGVFPGSRRAPNCRPGTRKSPACRKFFAP